MAMSVAWMTAPRALKELGVSTLKVDRTHVFGGITWTSAGPLLYGMVPDCHHGLLTTVLTVRGWGQMPKFDGTSEDREMLAYVVQRNDLTTSGRSMLEDAQLAAEVHQSTVITRECWYRCEVTDAHHGDGKTTCLVELEIRSMDNAVLDTTVHDFVRHDQHSALSWDFVRTAAIQAAHANKRRVTYTKATLWTIPAGMGLLLERVTSHAQ
jgi:hypothetical protein